MNELIEVAELAARVLREHSEAPRVATVSVGHLRGGWAAEFQLYGGPSTQQTVTAVAGWAAALGTTVSVIDHDSYVEISANATVDGRAVRAWDHLRGAEIVEFVLATGANVCGTSAEFTSAVLLGAFAAEAVA